MKYFSGVHVEGPFINVKKKGAHNEDFIRQFSQGMPDLLDMYGSLDNVALITLAPEQPESTQVIKELVKRGINVSVGN